MTLPEEIEELSHHSYCVVGGRAEEEEIIKVLESAHGMRARGNPDLIVGNFSNFTIDNARQLKASHETRPVGAPWKKIFIVTTDAIQTEAQNALLKLLEEPSDYAYFFLIVPSAHVLLSTVKSRLHLITRTKGGRGTKISGRRVDKEGETVRLAQEFMSLRTPGRLKLVLKFVENIKEGEESKRAAVDFLNELQRMIYESKGAVSGNKELEVVALARKYADDRAPSLKMLLEYVSLNIGSVL